METNKTEIDKKNDLNCFYVFLIGGGGHSPRDLLRTRVHKKRRRG